MKVFEGKYGGAGGTPGSLHHREPDHGPRGGTEVRDQQVHGPYGSDKLERLIWAIQ